MQFGKRLQFGKQNSPLIEEAFIFVGLRLVKEVREEGIAMSQTPAADIVIPVLNEAHVLRKSVKTVLDFSRANLPYRWQIVIVG